MRAAFLLATCCLLFTASAARGAETSALAESGREAAESMVSTGSEKSETAAVWLSTAGLVLPVATGLVLAAHSAGTNQSEIGATLVGAGLLLGPSVGYFYGGCAQKGWIGIAIRGGLAVVTIAAMAATGWGSGDIGFYIIVGGAGLVLIGLQAFYDCFAVASCVRHHNESSRMGIIISPGQDARSLRLGLHLSY
jgi:hypothetical protein